MNLVEIIKEEIFKQILESDENAEIAQVRKLIINDDRQELLNIMTRISHYYSDLAKNYIEEYYPKMKLFADLLKDKRARKVYKSMSYGDKELRRRFISFPSKDGYRLLLNVDYDYNLDNDINVEYTISNPSKEQVNGEFRYNEEEYENLINNFPMIYDSKVEKNS